MACDYVPAACEAARIANCVVRRDCSVDGLSLPGVKFGLEKSLGGFGDLHARLATFNVAFLAALAQAFVDSNCSMPVLPDFPDAPDFEDCLDQIDDMNDEGSDPLGILSEVITVTFGPTGLPIQISNS